MAPSVWCLPRPEALVHGPPMSQAGYLPSLPWRPGSQLSLKGQMISPAVLGKPCHWTVPGSWPPTHGPESRSPDLEGIPGGGRRVLGRERQDPALTESRESPVSFFPGSARVAAAQPQLCPVEFPVLARSPRQGREEVPKGNQPGTGGKPRPGRAQGPDFPLGRISRNFSNRKPRGAQAISVLGTWTWLLLLLDQSAPTGRYRSWLQAHSHTLTNCGLEQGLYPSEPQFPPLSNGMVVWPWLLRAHECPYASACCVAGPR